LVEKEKVFRKLGEENGSVFATDRRRSLFMAVARSKLGGRE
jgi:hypothetical protein